MFTKLLTTAGVLASLSAYAAELPPMTFMCGSEYAGDPQYTKAVTVRDRMLTVTGGGMTESDPITESDTLYAIKVSPFGAQKSVLWLHFAVSRHHELIHADALCRWGYMLSYERGTVFPRKTKFDNCVFVEPGE
jgi:hypothetical protein